MHLKDLKQKSPADLVAMAEELGILIVGPNGQGLISTPSHLCAQIVAPYPPAGRIGIASQSGNFVSSFMNYAHAAGVETTPCPFGPASRMPSSSHSATSSASSARPCSPASP